MDETWKSNPKLAGMDPEKLNMLSSLASQGTGKNPTEMLSFLMGAASRGKDAGLHFNGQEIDAILEVMKAGKSPEETAKIDRLVSLMKMIR